MPPPAQSHSWTALPLWPHQVKAINMLSTYLKSGSDLSALVRMPTGTGKTGVMAVVSHCVWRESVLIVAPWAYLTEQLENKIKMEFWDKTLKVRPEQALKRVTRFWPTSLESELQDVKEPAIFICTFQTLERLHAAHKPGFQSAFQALKDRVTLVFVDEGHREPAPQWADAVRSLEHPTVLFSATPYRNDHRLFRIDSDYVYRLSHAAAEEQRFIRQVKFVEKPAVGTPKAFVSALLDFYDGEFKLQCPSIRDDPRVIIRCATDDDIREIARELLDQGRTVVAVHDRFKRDEEVAEWNRVPSPDEQQAVFWVHQYKLIEGLDHPSFCLLALYQGFANARTLVQQVGRIIRNPNRKKKQVAYVFCQAQHKQKAMWDGYVHYERQLKSEMDASIDTVIEQMRNLQVELQYVDGNYRESFSPDVPDFFRYLAYRKSANIYISRSGFTLERLLDSIRKVLEDQDFVIRNVAEPDEKTRVIVYWGYHASPLLIDRLYLIFDLGFSVVRLAGRYVFYFDSQGVSPDYLREYADRVSPDVLERLFSGSKSRISQVSLLNTDLADYSVRRRTVSARSIGELAPSLGDHAHFCSTAVGVVPTADAAVRRYVGFTRARFSEHTAKQIDFAGFTAWVDSTAELLENDSGMPAAVFERFALNIAAPEKAEPEHILFDIEDVAREYRLTQQDQRQYEEDEALLKAVFDERCCEVMNSEFSCIVDGNRIPGAIHYFPDRRRFEIISPGLEQAFVRAGERVDRRRNLVAHLNREQAFRIVTDQGYIYAHGHFYKPRVPLWGRKINDRIDLLRVFVGIKELGQVTSEKGNKIGEEGGGVAPNGTGWMPGSVFELIDRHGSKGLFARQRMDPDVLICDDLGNELADFIAAQIAPPRVVLIHAKHAHKGGRVSASAFHDVCSQAVKNLNVLVPQRDRAAKNVAIFNQSWRKKEIGVVLRRIRRGGKGKSGQALWEQVEQILRDPSAMREVWIVMGGGMSLSAFDEARRKETPPPSVIQLIYLLQSTWSSVSAVGGMLRVFTPP